MGGPPARKGSPRVGRTDGWPPRRREALDRIPPTGRLTVTTPRGATPDLTRGSTSPSVCFEFEDAVDAGVSHEAAAADRLGAVHVVAAFGEDVHRAWLDEPLDSSSELPTYLWDRDDP
jgi:hypothetical protein